MLHSMWSLRAGHNCMTEQQHEPRGVRISASKQPVQNGNHFLSVPSQASSLPRRTSSLSIQMLRLKLQHHLWFLPFSHPVCLTYCKVYPAKVKVAQSCPTLCDSMGYPVHGNLQIRILEWVAFPFSRGIFPAQGLNPGLLHCRQILYQLSHKGSPRILERVAYLVCRGSSWPRNRTRVSCSAGRLPTELPGKPLIYDVLCK